MKTLKIITICTALLTAATGCIDDFTISGNGIAATENRITPDFSRILSEGAFDVHIARGENFEMVVNAESNILPYIETDVNGNLLRIHVRGLHSVSNRLPMEIFITVPELCEIKQSGSGIISTGEFETRHFDLAVSGSGSIETAVNATSVDAVISGSGILILSGTASNADFAVSGSGKIEATRMNLNHCDAAISGSGNMWIRVEQQINASISGSGNIYYAGSPAISKHISGSGYIFPYH